MTSLLHLAPFAALLAVLSVVLSILVVRQRYRHQLPLGVAEDSAMQRAVRAHANFHEYTPFALLMVALVAILGGPGLLVTGLGGLLVLSRVSHAYSVLVAESKYRTFRWRMAGMIGTFTTLVLSGGFLLWQWARFSL